MVYISTHQSFRRGFSWQLESYYKPVSSDTTSTQKLPTIGSNTLGLEIYCPLRIRFAPMISVYSSTEHS